MFASSAREWRADENDGIMKKVREKDNEMLREYDFSQGVRGKYARRGRAPARELFERRRI
jgi:hypothetical protein